MGDLSPFLFLCVNFVAAIIGTKKDMCQVFDKDGTAISCTIIDVSDVKVVGKREKSKDGYEAVMFGIGKKKNSNKSEKSKYSNLKYVPKKVCEFRSDKISGVGDLKIGDEVRAGVFSDGDKVKLTGITKGKGFQGVVKRWNFAGGPRTHGQSDRERSPGSIGGGTDPGRVFKGKKMPGHMGSRIKTLINVEIVKVDDKNSLILVKGAVPGARNSLVRIFGTGN